MRNVFGVTGWKNSGKTTLVSALVKELTRRGFRVSTIKNAHHSFEIDREGTDSWSHRRAGAQEVALVSQERWAIMHEVKTAGARPSLSSIIAKLAPCDLVLVEGFKNSDIPKIECIRAASQNQAPLWASNPSVVAVASDLGEIAGDKPHYALDDIEGIADFIEQNCGLDR